MTHRYSVCRTRLWLWYNCGLFWYISVWIPKNLRKLHDNLYNVLYNLTFSLFYPLIKHIGYIKYANLQQWQHSVRDRQRERKREGGPPQQQQQLAQGVGNVRSTRVVYTPCGRAEVFTVLPHCDIDRVVKPEFPTVADCQRKLFIWKFFTLLQIIYGFIVRTEREREGEARGMSREMATERMLCSGRLITWFS